MKRYILILLIGFGAAGVKAQLTPMKSQFFQNPYLVNPSMAGVSGRPEVYSNYSNQWNKLDGSPVLFAFSGSIPLNSKASIGMNLVNDKSGLLSKTQAMGSFSYKVPFSESQSIRFGVSLTWAQDRIDFGSASSTAASDPGLVSYNDRENYLDGNFGVAYINRGFEAQYSHLNLNQKRNSQFSTVDYSTFYSSVSYQFRIDETFGVKPLLAYRGVKNFDNQYDIAAELTAKELTFYSMYHSNKSYTGGIGFTFKKQLNMSVLYNSEPATLRGFTGGVIDLVIGYRF